MSPKVDKSEILEVISRMRGEGKSWPSIAQTLNSRRLFSRSGKPWTPMNCQVFASRHGLTSSAARRETHSLPDGPSSALLDDLAITGKAHESPTPGPSRELADDYEDTQPEAPTGLTPVSSSDLLGELTANDGLVPSGADMIALREVVQWWAENREIILSLTEKARTIGPDAAALGERTPRERPVFVGDRRNTSIEISAKVFEAARLKAKTRPPEGKSMSAVCEYLLWQWLGEPPGMVE